MQKYYQVGKIVNTHGIGGELRIVASTDFVEERFQVGQKLAVEMPDGYQTVEIIQSRQHKQFYLLKFAGYENINLAEVFKGHNLKVAASNRQDELVENEFYYDQIIGLEVVEQATGEVYGKISGILSPGANDVWVIKRRGKSDILIPYIASVVLKVDLQTQKVEVEMPEGLIDDAN